MGNEKRSTRQNIETQGTIARTSIVEGQIKRQQNNWRIPKPCWFQQYSETLFRSKRSCWRTSIKVKVKEKRHRQRGRVRVYSVCAVQSTATQILMIELVAVSIFTFSGMKRSTYEFLPKQNKQINLSIRRICHLTMQHKLAKMEPRQNCAFVFSELIFLFSFDCLFSSELSEEVRTAAIVCFPVFSFWKSLCIPRRSLKRNSLCCLSFMGSNLNRNVSFSLPKRNEIPQHNYLFTMNHVKVSQDICLFAHFSFSGLDLP